MNISEQWATGGDAAPAINAALAEAAAKGGGVVTICPGTYMLGGTILLPTTAPVVLRGAGVGITTLKLRPGVDADVISHADFASLAAGNLDGGPFRCAIEQLTVDGNRAANVAGHGIRLYGRGNRIRDVLIQQCANDGLHTLYGGPDDFGTPAGKLEATYENIEAIFNGGNGWTNKGPHDSNVSGYLAWQNGGWGLWNAASLHASNVNTYLNTLGGIYTKDCIGGSDVSGTTATGWGMLIDSPAGLCVLTASVFAGPIALEIRTPNHCISGAVANSSVAGVKLNGGSANMQLVMFNNSGAWFDLPNQNGASVVTAYGVSGAGTLFAGTPAGTWWVTGAKNFSQIQTQTIQVCGYTLTFPQANVTL